MNDVFVALLPYIILLVFGTGALFILFKFKGHQSEASFIVSLLFYILIFPSIFLMVAGLIVSETGTVGLIIYGIPALIFNFIATFYQNDLEHRFYQKFRTITLIIFNCLLILLAIIGVVDAFQRGVIGGISEGDAVVIAQKKVDELAKEKNRPKLTNAQCQPSGKRNEDMAGNKQVIYDIYCQYTYQGSYFEYTIEVGKKDGAIHSIR